MQVTPNYLSIYLTRMLLLLFTKLNACLQEVQQWMAISKLKLNPDKTEFIGFGSKVPHQKLSSHFPVSILGSLFHPADIVKNLGGWFHTDFSFSEYEKKI